jgi:hypothetical protein
MNNASIFRISMASTKTRNLFVVMLILSATILIIFPHAYASTCTYSEKYHTLPQIFLLSSDVFVGTVTTINNSTDHHWGVNFSIEKLWKGTLGQKSLNVTTNGLQGCGYSITTGEKYLVYAISSPPFLQTSWTKPYTDAQPDIALLNDPNFQAQEKAKENQNEKLEAAKEMIANMMVRKTLSIPLNGVGVDVLNSTLDVYIDSIKANMSKGEYKEKIKDLIGDLPIKVEFAQFIADTGNPDRGMVTPLQTHEKNGSNLTIHYETGIDVTGKVMPTGPPPQLDNPSPLPAIIVIVVIIGTAVIGISVFIIKKRNKMHPVGGISEDR